MTNWNLVAGTLRSGSSITIKPRGNSMSPLIESGQTVTLYPIKNKNDLEKGNVVLAKVDGRFYLHKIMAIKGSEETLRFQIGNNHGHINGWTSAVHVYGWADV